MPARPGRLLVDTLVLDVTRSLAGACTAWLLSRLGADVIQVCPVGAGTVREGADPGPWDAGKRSIALDLDGPHADPDEKATLDRLTSRADVVVAHTAPDHGHLAVGAVVVLVPEPAPTNEWPAPVDRALTLATRGAVAAALRLREAPNGDRVIDLSTSSRTRYTGGTPVAPDADGASIRRALGTLSVDTFSWDDEGGPVDGQRQVPHRRDSVPHLGS